MLPDTASVCYDISCHLESSPSIGMSTSAPKVDFSQPLMAVTAMLQAVCSSITATEKRHTREQRPLLDDWIEQSTNEFGAFGFVSAPRRLAICAPLENNFSTDHFVGLKNIRGLISTKVSSRLATWASSGGGESPAKRARLTVPPHADKATSPISSNNERSFALGPTKCEVKFTPGKHRPVSNLMESSVSPSPTYHGMTPKMQWTAGRRAEETPASQNANVSASAMYSDGVGSPGKRRRPEQPTSFAVTRATNSENPEQQNAAQVQPAKGPRPLGVSASTASLAAVPGLDGARRAPELARAGAAAAFAQPSRTGLTEEYTSPPDTPKVCPTWQSRSLFARHPPSPPTGRAHASPAQTTEVESPPEKNKSIKSGTRDENGENTSQGDRSADDVPPAPHAATLPSSNTSITATKTTVAFSGFPAIRVSAPSDGSYSGPFSPRLPQSAPRTSSTQTRDVGQSDRILQNKAPLQTQPSLQVSAVKSNIAYFETRSSWSLKPPSLAPNASAARSSAGGAVCSRLDAPGAPDADEEQKSVKMPGYIRNDNDEPIDQERHSETQKVDGSQFGKLAAGSGVLPASPDEGASHATPIVEQFQTPRTNFTPVTPAKTTPVHGMESQKVAISSAAQGTPAPRQATAAGTSKPFVRNGPQQPQLAQQHFPQNDQCANLLGAGGPSTFLQAGMKCQQSDKDALKGQGAEAYERLAAGGRREDIAKPKSLKAAEQVRLQEDRRQRERQERERSKQHPASSSHVGSSKQTAAVPGPGGGRQAAGTTVATGRAGCQASQAPAQAAAGASRPAGTATHKEQPQSQLAASKIATLGPAPPADSSATSAGQSPDALAFSRRPARSDCNGEVTAWVSLRQIQLPPKEPADNYEMSEVGDNSDDEQADKVRSHKFVPKWSEDFLTLLARQEYIDPDTIFSSRVPACPLEDVFTDEMYRQVGKTRPKRQRGSSGDWRRDRLTSNEVANYKGRMEHCKSWDASLCDKA